jgi:hypothetical protein
MRAGQPLASGVRLAGSSSNQVSFSDIYTNGYLANYAHQASIQFANGLSWGITGGGIRFY